MLAHVFAIGNIEEVRNSRHGRGSMPAGGMCGTPVTNMKTSSSVTALSFSVKALKLIR